MKTVLRTLFLWLTVFLLFFRTVYSADPDTSVEWAGKSNGIAKKNLSTAGVVSNFNFKNVSELQYKPFEQKLIEPQFVDVSPIHKTSVSDKFIPASQGKIEESGPSIPLINKIASNESDLNFSEDDRSFSSKLYSDTTLYCNYISGNPSQSSKNQGTFYVENLKYDLFTTNNAGDSLNLNLDTTHTNDRREYLEGFTLNHFSVESITPDSRIVLGHSLPSFSSYSITNQIIGLFGEQKFSNSSFKAFTGYKSIEPRDFENPRQVMGFRLAHEKDEAVTIGLNAVYVKDSNDNPNSDYDKPTLRNSVLSADVKIKPTENISLQGEYATSNTDFDRRANLDSQDSGAYKFSGAYQRENYQAEVGVETAGTGFLTVMGESPRDEQVFYGRINYQLNRFFSFKGVAKTTRDNMGNYKAFTVIRDLPEFTLTLKPSEYYKDMKLDFYYQPMHEYSDGVNLLDRNKDLMWVEFNQKAGSMKYYVGLSGYTDQDKYFSSNNQENNKIDLKFTWEYDQLRRLYGLYSIEQLYYKTLGGSDKTTIYGFGGRSQFHEDLSLNLDFTHESNYMKINTLDSERDRVVVSLVKEYQNLSRFIIEVEGADNRFMLSDRSFKDVSGKVRYQKSF
ncbi:MAG: hypothetical protein HQM08_19610 [Candidatus Riflebacteria bacterium]|nr:hypothetical protein [Candidatus Riflebacteria bacterium]